MPGRELRTDLERDAQYFAVTFPDFPTGEVVEYSPMLSCAGRQVPAPHIASRFPSRFRLPPGESPVAPQRVRKATPKRQRFAPGLDLLATVTVQFNTTQFLGETPAGMRINFFVGEGTARGQGFSAKVTQGTSDQMIVRRDGMGVVRIRGAFATDDGATLDVETSGYVDFGPDGYRRAVAHDLPDRSPIVLAPLISTLHPKYSWLSRVQCVGFGETHLDAGQVTYHAYAVSPRSVTATM